MSTNQSLLIELGTEELPPKALKNLSQAFTKNISTELTKAGFEFDQVKPFAAPRRLAVIVTQCCGVQPDTTVVKKGPAVSAAFDADGNPTRAAAGWASSNGISVEQADRLKTDKGEWLTYTAQVIGKTLDNEIQTILSNALKALPIPKAMRWGDSDAEFIRPVHTLCILHGDKVLPATQFGLDSSRQISGHRFHGQPRFELGHADDYATKLEEQYVVADYALRTAKIKQGLLDGAKQLGLVANFDQALLEEISSLVEWPVVLTASFENTFLEVPKEALIYTMKDDQKYVPLVDEQGNLSSSFLFVSNIDSKDPSQVTSGNEKVIRPRLADAKFFFETDKKTTLADKAGKLQSVLFQKELGTVAEKTQRLEKICTVISKAIGANSQHAERAAFLSKADLMSEMVMEFPSVQGVMGKYYALHDGEDSDVASAIEEQYLPRFSGDKLPSTQVGVVLALAEKLDTLIGIFGIGKIPKGDKDPFALRRSAIGLLRILIENKLPIEIQHLIDITIDVYGEKISNSKTSKQVYTFLIDRFKPIYSDSDINPDVIAAVLSKPVTTAVDVDARIKAVSSFAQNDSAQALCAANKRVANILNKNSYDISQDAAIDTELFQQSEERVLFETLQTASGQYNALVSKLDYMGALDSLTVFKRPLEAFFDNTMIMSDDLGVRANRLALIAKLHRLFSEVADISKLAV